MLVLDGGKVGLARFLGALAGPVELAPALRDRLTAARAAVEAHAAGTAPVYGLNTGLGANLGHRLAPGEIAGFQALLLAGRCVGTGEALPERTCRLSLLARIIGAARGAAGLTPGLLDRMAACHGAGLAPVLPSLGAIGAADFGLSAAMGAALTGSGEMWVAGTRRPAAEALSAAGFAPAVLAPKEALAFVTASAVTVALAAEAWEAARDALRRGLAVAALSGEGFAMNLSVLAPEVQALRPAAGQALAAAALARAFAGSPLAAPGAARAVQDPLSFRGMAPVFGAALAALGGLGAEAEAELDGAGDSPALLPSGALLSTPNFLTPGLALAADHLALALHHVAAASVQRVLKLLAERLSGLPRGLSPAGGAAAGFVPVQKTLAHLLGRIRHGANPASLDAAVVSEMVEDIAPQTPLALARLLPLLADLRLLTGIEAMVAAQAVDLRRPAGLGAAAARLHPALRDALPPLSEDRAVGPEIARAAAAVDTALDPDFLDSLTGEPP